MPEDLGHGATPLRGVRAIETMKVVLAQTATELCCDLEAALGPDRLGIGEHAIKIKDNSIWIECERRERRETHER